MAGLTKVFKNFVVKGCVCAPFTLFKEDGTSVGNENVGETIVTISREINFDGYEEYAKYLVSQKFSYVYVNGTMGEGMSMTQDERKKIAEVWVKVAKDRFGVILHVGGSNYKDSIELAKHSEEIGVDAIACFAPNYYKPVTEEALIKYITMVAAAAPNTPFYYYTINFYTGVYLNDHKILKLAADRIPNLAGLKHSSRELPNAHKCFLFDPERFQIMMGSDIQLLTGLVLGIEVPVIGSFLGLIFDKIKTAFDKGDMDAARKYQSQAQQVNTIRAGFGGGINVAKAIFNMVSGLDAGPVRLPLEDLTTDQKTELKKQIDESGLF